MSKLTDKQLELAVKAFSTDPEVIVQGVWNLKSCLRNSAPYLQIPWDEPTSEEVIPIYANLYHYKIEDVSPSSIEGITKAFVEFVRIRNAAILPKLVDPRIAIVVKVLRGTNNVPYLPIEKTAETVLAALDEVKRD